MESLQEANQIICQTMQKGFQSNFKSLEITDISNGAVTLEIKIQETHLNPNQVVHGGVLTSLMDISGAVAVLLKSRGTVLSVSISHSDVFISPAKEGNVLVLRSQVNKMGKAVAFVSTTAHVGDRLICMGTHVKGLTRTSKL